MRIYTESAAVGSPAYTETLPCEAASAPEARGLAGYALHVWGVYDEAYEDVALVVTELVANAVRHAATAPTIRVRVQHVRPGAVYVAVIDRSTALPVRVAAGNEGERGRGLALVHAVASAWGCDPMPWGKRVWAEVPYAAPPAGRVP
ncbi:ATP-binding protein [Streptomyces virginiae]|uniref:ATP-binding protein n=1 Tax=Streptomyces virginiae TaxID=1961 RepID=UPI003448B726